MHDLLLFWLVLVNLAGFVLMGLDKYRAKRGLWRIPERTLFFAALLGGTPGIIAGMELFRHKTRHNSFRYGMPGLLLGRMAVVVYVSLQNV